MNFSDLFVETAPCIGSHPSSDSSLSTVYSYFMLGRLDEYGYPDNMSPADVGLTCKIKLMVMVSPPSMDKSCEGIYKKLAYGFELSWIDNECTEKCRPDDTCALNDNNTAGIGCYPQRKEETRWFVRIIRPILHALGEWSTLKQDRLAYNINFVVKVSFLLYLSNYISRCLMNFFPSGAHPIYKHVNLTITSPIDRDHDKHFNKGYYHLVVILIVYSDAN
ncbi:hypothetical protein M0R45_015805 [Rubus argutus]|uniref:Uncharacterized protein n=1 Tax=Rubus argutus TaxID=59490 RepID=A0AAW1XRV2_RUBAR